MPPVEGLTQTWAIGQWIRWYNLGYVHVPCIFYSRAIPKVSKRRGLHLNLSLLPRRPISLKASSPVCVRRRPQKCIGCLCVCATRKTGRALPLLCIPSLFFRSCCFICPRGIFRRARFAGVELTPCSDGQCAPERCNRTNSLWCGTRLAFPAAFNRISMAEPNKQRWLSVQPPGRRLVMRPHQVLKAPLHQWNRAASDSINARAKLWSVWGQPRCLTFQDSSPLCVATVAISCRRQCQILITNRHNKIFIRTWAG